MSDSAVLKIRATCSSSAQPSHRPGFSWRRYKLVWQVLYMKKMQRTLTSTKQSVSSPSSERGILFFILHRVQSAVVPGSWNLYTCHIAFIPVWWVIVKNLVPLLFAPLYLFVMQYAENPNKVSDVLCHLWLNFKSHRSHKLKIQWYNHRVIPGHWKHSCVFSLLIIFFLSPGAGYTGMFVFLRCQHAESSIMLIGTF